MTDDPDFAALRAREYPQLDAARLAYLDYTGAALPSASQLRAHDALLRGPVLGNPHSEHAPSRAAAVCITRMRERVLRFFHADPGEFVVAFVASTTAAIKLVAESFPFGGEGSCVLSADNHNSVNGIREYARRAGAARHTIPLTSALRLDHPGEWLARGSSPGPRLFAFPAQSNFSGVMHPLELVGVAQDLGYTVLLDAAAYVPTSPLDLTVVRPDFMAVSFYKLFGIPTGVGALIARRDALARLRRPWFAGGTVDWVSVRHDVHQLRFAIDAFEDGSPNYYGIAALESGFDLLDRVGMARVRAHVHALTDFALCELARHRHANGVPRFRIYGPADAEGRGGTVALNVTDRDGRAIPYELVESVVRAAKVALRGGCFCNPGAAEAAFEFPPDWVRCLTAASGPEFTPRRFAECLGPDQAVGAIRLSVGLPTTREDVCRGIDALVAAGGSVGIG